MSQAWWKKLKIRLSSFTEPNFTTYRLLAFVTYYIVGVSFFMYREKWGVLDATYFVTVSVTTIGYGCLFPTTDTSRLFDTFFILFGCCFILSFAQVFYMNVISKFQEYCVESYFQFFYNRSPDSLCPRDKRIFKVIMCIAAIALNFTIGTTFYTYNEHWTTINAMYYTVVTMTANGFGDICIHYQTSRLFGIFYCLSSTIVYSLMVGNMFEHWEQTKHDDEADLTVAYPLDWCHEVLADWDKHQNMSSEKFIYLTLLREGVLTQDDIDTVRRIVDSVGTSGEELIAPRTLLQFTQLCQAGSSNNTLRSDDVVNPAYEQLSRVEQDQHSLRLQQQLDGQNDDHNDDGYEHDGQGIELGMNPLQDINDYESQRVEDELY